MTLAIITMVYNEAVNLPVWRDHYRATAPNAELFVIDHGSDDGSAEKLQGVCRLPVPRGEMEEWARTNCVQFLQASLLQYFDWVIYTDCDELIVADPAISASLEAHLQSRTYEYAAPIGLNLQHITTVEPPLVAGSKLLSQRRYCYFQSNMCKPLISRIPLKWNPGFHTCDTKLNIDPDLYLFHIRAVDRDRALLRQKTLRYVQWSRKAIEANHGRHHRFSDAALERRLFGKPAERFERDGAGPFVFDDQIRHLQDTANSSPVGTSTPAFKGPLVEIPDRFRDLF